MAAGRKLEFDKQASLEKAMRIFWENGYSATSLSVLIRELGISKPSLYNTFGNKDSLFTMCFQHYVKEYSMPRYELLRTSPSLPLEERIRMYLYALIDLYTKGDTPKGCFYVKCLAEAQGPFFPEELSNILLATHKSYCQSMIIFFEEEIGSNTLSSQADTELLADCLITTGLGIAVQARSNKSPKSLRKVADVSISNLPI
ncbi:TetR/AcrR family transcriptional regulator [Alteromonadaceae bacterium M269]|nr:TetR/AcrR family transcriptional regulator [Alteromonadaceae bacterium M269]